MKTDPITDEQVSAAKDCANELTPHTVQACCDLANQRHTNPTAVLFGLWVNLSEALLAEGWTVEELRSDLGPSN